MSIKILNLKKTLFLELQEQLGILSSKEEKLMMILELAMSSTAQMLASISTSADIGRKINVKGNGYAWIGGKLRLGAVDGDIPITAIYTSASVHDSQVAIPIINETAKRVDYLYDLCDKGYDSQVISQFSTKQGHAPIIDINPRNCEETKIAIEGQRNLEKMGFNTPMSNHYNHRSSVRESTPISKTLLDASISMSKAPPKLQAI